MNASAARHLDKAARYVERGEEFYAKAADEIIAAQEADPTLSNREIGERFDRSENWVRKVVRWRTTSTPTSPIDWGKGDPKPTAELVLKGLEDEEVRTKVLGTSRGLSAIGRASIEAQTIHPRPQRDDPLPEPPAFAATFWRAVRYVDAAHEHLDRHGVGTLDLEPDARDAAKRLRRRAGEIAAAVAESFTERSLTETEA